MANVITVKSFSSPYDERGVVSASTTRLIGTSNIIDVEAFTNPNQSAIKSIIRVKYAAGRETKAGSYYVNETVTALATAING